MSNALAVTQTIDITANIHAAKLRYSIVKRLIDDKVLKPGVHYGTIPGSNKPTLMKPGAEMLISANMFTAQFEFIERTERWDEDNPLFYYLVRCHIHDALTGNLIANADGSCSSMESKYRWRWLWANEVTDDMDKSKLKSKKTKNGHMQYRVLNDAIFDLTNTILKMAEKRALVAAVLIAASASDYFTQDMEDFGYVQDSAVDVEPITTNSSETRQKAENSGFDGSSGVNSSNAGETAIESANHWIDELAALVLPFGYDNEHHARASIAKLANGKVEGYKLQVPTEKTSAKALAKMLENNAIVIMYYCADKIHGWDKAQVNAVLGAALNEGDNPAPLKKFDEWTAAGFGLQAAWNTLRMAKEVEAEAAPESGATDDIPW